MIKVLATTWPLLLGVLLLMVGNGVQGSLLGIRGSMESFETFHLSLVISGYFGGFLAGSQLAPVMIRNVGHVRVFAALGSLISAVLVVFPMLVEWQAWLVLRLLIGFGFAGIYVTAESWLNNTATNETRGQSLSLYLMVQMIGIIASQAILASGDPAGYELFLIPSVLVSLAFLPILLAQSPAPTFETSERLGFRDLFRISPLGCVGILISGGVFSAMLGMAPIWGSRIGLSVREIALFTSTLYFGGLILQYPIGYLSDRGDRRRLMLILAALAAVVMLLAAVLPLPFYLLLLVAAVLGGVTYPMYSLLISYTNDFLHKEQMAAAAAGMIFINGFGAIFGPLITGWLMDQVGPSGFFLFVGLLYALQVAYTLWRMGQRQAPSASGPFQAVVPTATTVATVAVLTSAAEKGETMPAFGGGETAAPADAGEAAEETPEGAARGEKKAQDQAASPDVADGENPSP